MNETSSSKIKGRLEIQAAIFGAVAAIVAALGGYLLSAAPQKSVFVPTYESYTQDINSIKNETIRLKGELSQLDRRLDRLGSVKPQEVSLSELKVLVSSLEKRLASLEKIILDSPEKAISLPLLKRDLDNIKSSHDAQIASIGTNLSASVNQLYTIIGTVTVVIGVGLLGALFAMFTAKKG